jgi:hypothetical protein
MFYSYYQERANQVKNTIFWLPAAGAIITESTSVRRNNRSHVKPQPSPFTESGRNTPAGKYLKNY